VYVVWRPEIEPSPFVTETATAMFKTVEEAMAAFQKKGYVHYYQLPLHGLYLARPWPTQPSP
jgi:hypothetical protein